MPPDPMIPTRTFSAMVPSPRLLLPSFAADAERTAPGIGNRPPPRPPSPRPGGRGLIRHGHASHGRRGVKPTRRFGASPGACKDPGSFVTVPTTCTPLREPQHGIHGNTVYGVNHVYAVYMVYSVHRVYTVYRVHRVYTVYSVHRVYTVYSVHHVYTVYRVHHVYTVYAVYSVHHVYAVYTVYTVHGVNHVYAVYTVYTVYGVDRVDAACPLHALRWRLAGARRPRARGRGPDDAEGYRDRGFTYALKDDYEEATGLPGT